MGKEAIKYLKDKGIDNGIVFQSKTKRIWLSDLMDVYAKHTNAKQVKSVDLADVVGRSEQLPQNFCTLNQQTCGKGSACKYPHCHL